MLNDPGLACEQNDQVVCLIAVAEEHITDCHGLFGPIAMEDLDLLISGQFFRSGMSSRFTGMGAGSAQWVVSSNPLELPDAPTRTVSTTVPAVSCVCSSARRVAQTPSCFVSDRAAGGPAHRLAAFSSPVAARERHHARRFDRAPLAPNVGRDPVRDRAGVRTRRARQPAQAGPRPVPAVAGRYPANHALHAEYVSPR